MRFVSKSIPILITMTRLLADPVTWGKLSPLPDRHGFAGAFAGVSGNTLLVAGGANFPNAPLAEGGLKVWHDRVFSLDRPDGEWREAGKLPGPRGYGVSINTAEGVFCIGGSDVERHHAECFLLKLKDGVMETVNYPPLPVPLANMAGARLGDVVYVAGGTSTPADSTASRGLFALDLKDTSAAWKTLESIPGAGRILPVAAAQGGSFFIVSGASLTPDAAGKPVRAYLKDAWRYQPGKGWSSIADIPRAAVAAPTPAPVSGENLFLIAGGDDGSLAGIKPGSPHPGFPRSVVAYDLSTNSWNALPDIPAGFSPPVTTPTTVWGKHSVIASGEVRPGIRSPQMIFLQTHP
jgi:N-acetylneuraminate epimerase